MKNSIEKISAITIELDNLRDQLLALQTSLKETVSTENDVVDNVVLNQLLNHIDNFKELKIPELINIASLEVM